MFHIFEIVASAIGLIGGILGIMAFFVVRRRRAFEDYVARKRTDRSCLGGRPTGDIPSELPSRLEEFAKKKGMKPWRKKT